jgi:hypothetical protein
VGNIGHFNHGFEHSVRLFSFYCVPSGTVYIIPYNKCFVNTFSYMFNM